MASRLKNLNKTKIKSKAGLGTKITNPFKPLKPKLDRRQRRDRNTIDYGRKIEQLTGRSMSALSDDRNPIEKLFNLGNHQGAFSDVMELFDRPYQAIAGATNSLFEGRKVWRGFTSGLKGTRTTSPMDIMHSAGLFTGVSDGSFLTSAVNLIGGLLLDPLMHAHSVMSGMRRIIGTPLKNLKARFMGSKFKTGMLDFLDKHVPALGKLKDYVATTTELGKSADFFKWKNEALNVKATVSHIRDEAVKTLAEAKNQISAVAEDLRLYAGKNLLEDATEARSMIHGIEKKYGKGWTINDAETYIDEYIQTFHEQPYLKDRQVRQLLEETTEQGLFLPGAETKEALKDVLNALKNELERLGVIDSERLTVEGLFTVETREGAKQGYMVKLNPKISTSLEEIKRRMASQYRLMDRLAAKEDIVMRSKGLVDRNQAHVAEMLNTDHVTIDLMNSKDLDFIKDMEKTLGEGRLQFRAVSQNGRVVRLEAKNASKLIEEYQKNAHIVKSYEYVSNYYKDTMVRTKNLKENISAFTRYNELTDKRIGLLEANYKDMIGYVQEQAKMLSETRLDKLSVKLSPQDIENIRKFSEEFAIKAEETKQKIELLYVQKYKGEEALTDINAVRDSVLEVREMAGAIIDKSPFTKRWVENTTKYLVKSISKLGTIDMTLKKLKDLSTAFRKSNKITGHYKMGELGKLMEAVAKQDKILFDEMFIEVSKTIENVAALVTNEKLLNNPELMKAFKTTKKLPYVKEFNVAQNELFKDLIPKLNEILSNEERAKLVKSIGDSFAKTKVKFEAGIKEQREHIKNLKELVGKGRKGYNKATGTKIEVTLKAKYAKELALGQKAWDIDKASVGVATTVDLPTTFDPKTFTPTLQKLANIVETAKNQIVSSGTKLGYDVTKLDKAGYIKHSLDDEGIRLLVEKDKIQYSKNVDTKIRSKKMDIAYKRRAWDYGTVTDINKALGYSHFENSAIASTANRLGLLPRDFTNIKIAESMFKHNLIKPLTLTREEQIAVAQGAASPSDFVKDGQFEIVETDYFRKLMKFAENKELGVTFQDKLDFMFINKGISDADHLMIDKSAKALFENYRTATKSSAFTKDLKRFFRFTENTMKAVMIANEGTVMRIMWSNYQSARLMGISNFDYFRHIAKSGLKMYKMKQVTKKVAKLLPDIVKNTKYIDQTARMAELLTAEEFELWQESTELSTKRIIHSNPFTEGHRKVLSDANAVKQMSQAKKVRLTDKIFSAIGSVHDVHRYAMYEYAKTNKGMNMLERFKFESPEVFAKDMGFDTANKTIADSKLGGKFLFYQFAKKNQNLQLRLLRHDPLRAVGQFKKLQFWNMDSEKDELGKRENLYKWDHYNFRIAVGKTDDGRVQYLNISNPMVEALRLFMNDNGNPTPNFKHVFSMLHPIYRWPLEAVFHTDIYSGKDIGEENVAGLWKHSSGQLMPFKQIAGAITDPYNTLAGLITGSTRFTGFLGRSIQRGADIIGTVTGQRRPQNGHTSLSAHDMISSLFSEKDLPREHDRMQWAEFKRRQVLYEKLVKEKGRRGSTSAQAKREAELVAKEILNSNR